MTLVYLFLQRLARNKCTKMSWTAAIRSIYNAHDGLLEINFSIKSSVINPKAIIQSTIRQSLSK